MANTASKKAQVQMGETIAVLFVFFLLFVIGLIFYTSIAKSGLKTQQIEQDQVESVEILKRALSMPELQCSQNNAIDESCIDEMRAKQFSSVLSQNLPYYYDLFGISTITLQKIYPIDTPPQNEVITIYQREAPAQYRGISRTVTPVSIRYFSGSKSDGYLGFGLLTIESYST